MAVMIEENNAHLLFVNVLFCFVNLYYAEAELTFPNVQRTYGKAQTAPSTKPSLLCARQHLR